MPISQGCSECNLLFEVNEAELASIARLSPVIENHRHLIPVPTLCPSCRRQRRIAWRNERSLFRRECDNCGQNIISMYSPEAAYRVFCPACYWSDDWTHTDYGREVDFSRPIFSQFEELLASAPLISIVNVNSENSEFCHRIFGGRNNYMSFIALYSPENLIHTYYTQNCKSSVDISVCQKVQLGYDLVDAENCYNCRYSNRIRNCSDSYFLQDCIGCSNCFGCKNLHQKSFCVFNEKYSENEYLNFVQEANLSSRSSVEKWRIKANDFHQTQPSRMSISQYCENVSGTNIFHSKNCQNGFDLYECEMMNHCGYAEKCHTCVDCYGLGECQYCYETVTGQCSHSCLFSATAIESSGLMYCYDAFANSQNCFACCGTKKGEFCILNKQYSREEYYQLLGRILDHMRNTGEWGQFFPIKLAPFAYNESDAQLEFPLDQNSAFAKGFKWQTDLDRIPSIDSASSAESIPDDIEAIQDDIVNEVFLCSRSGRPFRFVQPEVEFYLKNALPLPSLHPDERHRQRMDRRNPRVSWRRECDKCNGAFPSTYPPAATEQIYCQECYRREIF